MAPARSVRRGLVYYLAPKETSGTRKSNVFEGGVLDLVLNDGAIASAAGPSNNIPEAIAFPGTSGEYLDSAGVSIPALSVGRYPAFTVNLWAYTAAENTLSALCGVFGASGGTAREWVIVRNAATPAYELRRSADGSATSNVAFTGAGATGEWHMLTVRYQGGRLSLQVDLGTPATATGLSAASWFTASGSQFAVGGDTNNFSHNGRVAHLAIWRRALTDAELVYLYNAGTGRPVVPLA